MTDKEKKKSVLNIIQLKDHAYARKVERPIYKASARIPIITLIPLVSSMLGNPK